MPPQRHRSKFGVRLRNDWQLLALTLPMLVALLVFTYVPLLGNVIAFQDWQSSFGDVPFPFSFFVDQEWVGLEQFTRLMGDAYFWHAVRNTVFYFGLQIIFFFPVPIILALLINGIGSYWGKSLLQTLYYLPHFLSWVVVVAMFTRVFGGAGFLASGMRSLGMGAPQVVGNPDVFPALVLAQMIWKDAGWETIIYLAALSGVASELYEAAAVDGANAWRRLWHITLPAIRPVIVLLLIMRLGDALTVGFEQFILQRDAVGVSIAEVLDTYVYTTGVKQGDYSYGAAAGLVKGVVGLLLILAANKVAHMLGEDGVFRRHGR